MTLIVKQPDDGTVADGSVVANLDDAVRTWLDSKPPTPDVMRLLGELQELVDMVARAAARHTTRNGTTQLANGWTVKRSGGTLGGFKEWDNDRLRPLVVDRVAAQVVDTGEDGEPDPDDVALAKRAAMATIDLSGSWREKGLRAAGLDPEDYARRDMTPVRVTVMRNTGPAL